MRKIEKTGIYILTVVLLLFVSLSSYGQSRQDKTSAIIKELKLAEPHKMNYEYRLKELMYHATGSDSVKLVEMEKQFTDENIIKVISGGFDEVLTNEEINGIYNFLQSNTYKKLINPGELFKVISDQFKDIDKEIDRITISLKNKMEKPIQTFEPISVDREDGFYSAVDYNRSMEDKDIQLEAKPSLSFKNILEVTKESYGDELTEIIIQFTKDGAQKLYLFTKENIGKPMAIVIAKQIVAMPNINDAIMGGRSSIIGHFTEGEVDEMMKRLKEKE